MAFFLSLSLMSDEAVWETCETHFSVLSECWVVGVFKGTREHEEPTIPASINNARKRENEIRRAAAWT